jgi:hypothetical protein
MCYDSTFWQWACARPDVGENDGWLKGAYLVPGEWFDTFELMDESRFYPTNRHAAAAFRQAAE